MPEIPSSPIGPDCRDNKHPGCAETAFDEERDEIVDCACPCHFIDPARMGDEEVKIRQQGANEGRVGRAG